MDIYVYIHLFQYQLSKLEDYISSINITNIITVKYCFKSIKIMSNQQQK